MKACQSFLVDGINSIAIHNGVIRLQFMCLSMDGEPLPAVQLNIPINSINMILDALNKSKMQ